uniref:hypothetical protein n=1 Tax=Edwardsiella tarda TaxID=636 RepID=UPI001C37CE96
TNMSQCCKHLGETTESVGSLLAHSQPYKETLENRASEILLISCLTFHLGFACRMSSGALTDNIFADSETSECFLSNEIKNMHILGSEPELQAVRFGYVFRREKSRGVA